MKCREDNRYLRSTLDKVKSNVPAKGSLLVSIEAMAFSGHSQRAPSTTGNQFPELWSRLHDSGSQPPRDRRTENPLEIESFSPATKYGEHLSRPLVWTPPAASQLAAMPQTTKSARGIR